MTAITHALSTALLHFVWQGILAALFLWTALLLLRNRSANARYAISCAALAVLTVVPILTIYVVDVRPATPRVGADLAQTVGGFLTSPVAAQINWLALIQAWAVPVWSCGVLLFSLRLLWGCRQVSALRRRGEPAPDAVVGMVAHLAARMRITRAVRVLISSVADGPSVVGWLRPLILLPAATVLGLSAEQLEAVLAHELAHIRRYDYLINILQMLVETLFFYHPAVWWISSRIRHERELCCDDAAVRCCGDAVCYARALTTLERLRIMTPALALGVTDGPLMYRVQRLLGASTRDYSPSRLPAALAICLAVACFGLNINRARGQAQPPALPLAPAPTSQAQSPATPRRPSIRLTNKPKEGPAPAPAPIGDAPSNQTVLYNVEPLDVYFTNAGRDLLPPTEAELQDRIQRSLRTVEALKRQQVEASPRGAEQLQEKIDGIERGLETSRRELARPHGLAGRTVKYIGISGIYPADPRYDQLLARLPIRVGQTLSADSIERSRNTVRDFDQHAEAAFLASRDDGQVTVEIVFRGRSR